MKSHITACGLALALAGPLAAVEAPATAPPPPDAAAINDIKAYCLDFNWAVTDRKRMKHHNPPHGKSRTVIRILPVLPLVLCCVCGQESKPTAAPPALIESLRRIGSTEGVKPYDGNPILKPGPAGSFDAGALGSMCVLMVGGVRSAIG